MSDEIEPLINGVRAEWPEGVNAVSIYISGSKTDWLNQCVIRSHNLIPSTVPNSHLRPVRSLAKQWEIRPDKFLRNNEMIFAHWKSGKPVKLDRVVSLLRMAVFEQGLNQAAFPLHFLRAGAPHYIWPHEILS